MHPAYHIVPILYVLASNFYGDSYPQPYTSMLKKIAIQWSCRLFEKGLDSYHLRILAGLVNENEINLDLIRDCLKELNIALPSIEVARRELMIHYLEGCFSKVYSTEEALSIVMSFYYVTNLSPEIPNSLYLASFNWDRLIDGEYPSYQPEITDEEQQIKFIHSEFKKLLKHLKM